MILRGKGGIQYNLAPTPFAQGGEGQIFNINGMPDKVAKLYKAGKITADHERKLIKMVMTPPDQDVLSQIAWPLDVLYDNGTFVGFIMHKFKLNEDLNVIYEYGSSAKYPEMTWGNKIRIAKNLCVVLNAVHEAGHVCGDFNPKNISVDPNTGHITFVDTDSYHITDGNNIYRCNVGMPEYLPREIQIKMHNGLANAALPTFSQATDNFALAVHIFQLLMNGVHPFACAVIPSQDSVPIPSTSDSILNGECPFFKNVPGKQIPKFAPSADILPQEIKRLFMLAFVEGHASPSARPSAETWYYALERLEKNLKPCRDVGHHEYHNSLSACPWCEADQRFSGALSSAKSGGLKQSTFTPPVAPPPTRSTYTPPTTRNPSYTPSPGSVSSSGTSGSSSPTYVGASSYGTTTNQKKGSFKKKVITAFIIVAILIVAIVVVINSGLGENIAGELNPDKSDVLLQSINLVVDKQTDLSIGDTITLSFTPNPSNPKYAMKGGEEEAYDPLCIEYWVKYDGKSKQISSREETATYTFEKAGQYEIQAVYCNHSSYSSYHDTEDINSQVITIQVGGRKISSASDLAQLNNSSENFELSCDIDMSGVNHTPIEGFTGTLNGNGYTIKNLKINSSSSNVGLFSTLKGTVTNLKFANATITVSGMQENVGILCGVNKGAVSNVTVDGTVDAKNCKYVGGIFGTVNISGDYSASQLENKANVSGTDSVGGIAGRIYNSYSSSSKTTQLSDFKNSGKITGTGSYVGGIVGDCDCSTMLYIMSFSNTGNVSGKTYVGGIAGFMDAYSDSYIQDSSNASAVSAEAIVGCIAGKSVDVCVNSCTNAGSSLTATGNVIENGKTYAYVGGYVGYGTGANNCVNEVEIKYTGGGACVGGIAGYFKLNGSYSFTQLENKANVSGADAVGGIVGRIYNSYSSSSKTTQLSNFKNSGSITGTGSYVGGVVGDCDCSTMLYITGCDNTGTVQGTEFVGGIVGYGYGYKGSYIENSQTQYGEIAGGLKNVTVQ